MIGSAAFFVVAMMADATAAAPAAKPVDPLDKVICHRELETGSLTRVRKECRTRREWGKIADANRRDAETMQARSSAFRSE